MVALTGLSFVLSLSTESRAANLHGGELQLEQALGSGLELLKAVCSVPHKQRQQLGGVFDNVDLFRGVAITGDRDNDSPVHFSIVSPQTESTRIAGIRFGVQDESARLSLTALADWERREEGAAAKALLNLPGMTNTMADSILDWIDTDAAPRPSGAEARYYAARGLPYGPRNSAPISLEELLLVRDVRRSNLFGSDWDSNYRTGQRERGMATNVGTFRSDAGGLPWSSLLTVYSAERNVAHDGQSRVYVNENNLEILQQQLEQWFDASWMQFIIAYRQLGPYDETQRPSRPTVPRRSRSARASSDGRPEPEVISVEEMQPVDLSLPARFEIKSVLDLVGARLRIPGAERDDSEQEEDVVVESPFSDDPIEMQDYLPGLLDRTTTVRESIIRGRVNVNLAPREVLLGVPGLDPPTVDRIIATRGRRFGQSGAERHAVWLLLEQIVDIAQMKELLPYVTGGGDVFRAQVVGFHGDSGLSARAEVVIDATVSPPRQIYWKDVSLLGRGYTLDVLGVER